jgi:hypothetical protein
MFRGDGMYGYIVTVQLLNNLDLILGVSISTCEVQVLC